MTTSPSTQTPKNRRMLAAIMFSDVVGFSSRMGEHELRTAALVQRDLEFMSRKCERRSGQVIKTTGDGLLVIFDSAVEAVSAAIDIQTAMAGAAKKLSAEQVLQHRIAIHLGDIILTDDDVMGEGVNVAARLQTLAEPGGVCISEPTYEVVKNRLKFEAVYVGPRELKNIADPIGIYHISPSSAVGSDSALGNEKPAAGSPRKAAVAWAIGLAVVVMLGAALALMSGGGADAVHSTPVAPRPPAVTEAPAEVSLEQAAAEDAPPGPEADFVAVRAYYVKRHDFAAIAGRLVVQPDLIPNAKRRAEVIERYQKLAMGRDTILIALRTLHSRESPLSIAHSAFGPAWTVWLDGDNLFHTRHDGIESTLKLAQLTPVQMLQIVKELVAEEARKRRKEPAKNIREFIQTLTFEYSLSQEQVREWLH